MYSPKICVVITAKDTWEALEILQKVIAQCPDLIEIRFDYMEFQSDPAAIRKITDLPLIATNRRKDQGGYSKLNEQERVGSIIEAIDAGFEYADIELNTPHLEELGSQIKNLGGKFLVSHHDYQKTPPIRELRETMNQMLDYGADLCKIIGTARSPADNLTYLSLYSSREKNGLVCFGMGNNGVLSRVLTPLLGGEFTYASFHSGRESAPGQLTLSEMREIYNLLGI